MFYSSYLPLTAPPEFEVKIMSLKTSKPKIPYDNMSMEEAFEIMEKRNKVFIYICLYLVFSVIVVCVFLWVLFCANAPAFLR